MQGVNFAVRTIPQNSAKFRNFARGISAQNLPKGLSIFPDFPAPRCRFQCWLGPRLIETNEGQIKPAEANNAEISKF